MHSSISICSGFHALPHDLITAWKGNINRFNACHLAGFSIIHKYNSPDEVQKAYDISQNKELLMKCFVGKSMEKSIENFQKQGPGASPDTFKEWKSFFDNSALHHANITL
jgi:hypothetical protein